jgi:hypothetical protein
VSGDVTTKVALPCCWCGGQSVSLVDVSPPGVADILGAPAFEEACAIAPRWRWCARNRFFFACLSGEATPDGTPMPGAVR